MPAVPSSALLGRGKQPSIKHPCGFLYQLAGIFISCEVNKLKHNYLKSAGGQLWVPKPSGGL